MVRNYVLAAVAAGGLGLMASAPASAADGSIGVDVGAAPAYAGYMPVGYRHGWRGHRGYGYRGYRHRHYGYRRAYRPAIGFYVAPRPRYYGYRAYRRCWINRRGYRVCG